MEEIFTYNDISRLTDVKNGNTRLIPPSQCDVTYNLRNRPETLYENGYNVTLDYDASGMRRHTQITNGQTLVREKTRISDFYEEESTQSRSRRLDYIYAEGRVVAVRVGDVQNIQLNLFKHSIL